MLDANMQPISKSLSYCKKMGNLQVQVERKDLASNWLAVAVCRRASFDAGATSDAEVCRSRKALANFLFRNNQLANGGC